MTIRRNRPVEITDAPEHRNIPLDNIELRDDEDENVLTLTGYASTFEPYEMYGGPEKGGWIEQLGVGAFERTLREKPDLHLLINHAGMPLARTKSGTLGLSVDHIGLKVEARLDKRDPEVAGLAIKMDRKDMDEMSFAFRVKAQEWTPAEGFEELDDQHTLRTITEVSLHKGDVSVVNWGANPTTSASVRSAPELLRAFVECDDVAEIRSDDTLLKKVADKIAELRKPEPDDLVEQPVVEDEKREITVETVLADIEAAGLMEVLADAFRSILGVPAPVETEDESRSDETCGDCDKESDDCVCATRSEDGKAESAVETDEVVKAPGISLRYAKALADA